MTAPYRCGDAECWCAHATGLVVATGKKRKGIDVESADKAVPLRMRPNHRGYMLAMLTAPASSAERGPRRPRR